DALVVQSGGLRLAQPGQQLAADPRERVGGQAAERPDHERPLAGPALDQALVLEHPIGLQDRVRVDRQLGHDLTHRRQLVAVREQTQTARLLDLLDDLEVGDEAGTVVAMKLDHTWSPSNRLLSESSTIVMFYLHI